MPYQRTKAGNYTLHWNRHYNVKRSEVGQRVHGERCRKRLKVRARPGMKSAVSLKTEVSGDLPYAPAWAKNLVDDDSRWTSRQTRATAVPEPPLFQGLGLENLTPQLAWATTVSRLGSREQVPDVPTNRGFNYLGYNALVLDATQD